MPVMAPNALKSAISDHTAASTPTARLYFSILFIEIKKPPGDTCDGHCRPQEGASSMRPPRLKRHPGKLCAAPLE